MFVLFADSIELKSTAVLQVKVIEELFADVGNVAPQAKMKLLLLAVPVAPAEPGVNGGVILLHDKKITKIAEKLNPVNQKYFFIGPTLKVSYKQLEV
jgi:hypothetical protein